jgi:hypothetical protein
MDSHSLEFGAKYRDGLTIDAFGLPPMATAIAKTIRPSMLQRVASLSGTLRIGIIALLTATPWPVQKRSVGIT